MKPLDQITDELVEDALDTCIVDSNYLRSLLQVYFKNMSEEERRKQHADAFEDTED